MKKIFIADDSLTIQKILKLTLESQGYFLKIVSSQDELLRALAEEKSEILFLDAHLPGLPTKDFLSKLESWKLKIFLIIHEFDEFSLKDFQPLQVIDFLQRPFEPEQVLETLEKILLFGEESYKATQEEVWDMSIPGQVLDFHSREKVPPPINPTPDQTIELKTTTFSSSMMDDSQLLETLLKGPLKEDIEKILWKIVPEITERIVTKEIQQIKEDILKE